MSFSLFPAFYFHPQKVRFAEQEEDEQILLLLRQHWVTNLSWIFIALVSLLVPLLGLFLNQAIFLTAARYIDGK